MVNRKLKNLIEGKTGLVAFVFAFSILAFSGASVSSYDEDFESYSIGDYPSEWNQWQNTSCGASDCEEGHAFVADNYSVSGDKSLECLEKTKGIRRCFLPVEAKLDSNLSLNYSLNVKAGSRFARISIFQNLSDGYKHWETLAELEGNGSDQNTTGGFKKDLSEYAGDKVLIGMEVSGESDGTGRSWAAIDDMKIEEGKTQLPSDLEKTVEDRDGTDPLVMGRNVNTTFSYEAYNLYYPIDTAIVIDGSGSMADDPDNDGQTLLDEAKNASKKYINSTNTSLGDENSVIEFNSSQFDSGPAAAVLQNLTDNKTKARNAVDSIESGGNTNISAGIQNGTAALENGSNPIKAMIVLADGKHNAGDPQPGVLADRARNENITVHGIMFGGGADTAQFEEITNSSECVKDSSENSDDDKCWYAKSNTVQNVFQDIRADLTSSRSADLYMKLPDYAYNFTGSEDFKPGSNFDTYIERDIPLTGGENNFTLRWSPTNHSFGSLESIAPGDSYINLTLGGETKFYNYSNVIERNITYVDFDLEDVSVVRREEGVTLNYTVKNEGNTASDPNNATLEDDELPENVSYLDSIDPSVDPVRTFSKKFENDNHFFIDPAKLNLSVDEGGRWDSRTVPGKASEGKILEPNESNNDIRLGFPPNFSQVRPESISWNDTFEVEMSALHFDPSTVDGYYNFTRGGTQVENNEDLDKDSTSGDEINFSTLEVTADTSKIYYNFSFRLEGDRKAYSVFNRSYFVENIPPQIYPLNPSNGGVIESFPVDLRAEITDENDDYVNFSIHNAETGNQLNYSEDFLVNNSNTTEYQWTPPDTTKTDYSWKVNVTDGDIELSEVFTFSKETGRLYRSKLSFGLNYSTLIMRAGSSRYVELRIDNNALSDKNITLELSGIDAEFLRGGTTYDIPDFDAQSTEEVAIRVTPDSVTDDDLTITAVNNDLGLETRKTLPVEVEPSVSEGSRDVPGIGLIQLIMLFSVATVLYSVQL